MNKIIKILNFSTLISCFGFLLSCNKSDKIEIDEEKIQLIRNNDEFNETNSTDLFNTNIVSKSDNDHYYYSFILNNPKERLNKIQLLLIDIDNNGYIVGFGFDKEYNLILGDKKENDTNIPGININFSYQFEAKSFKLYSSFYINSQERSEKLILNVSN